MEVRCKFKPGSVIGEKFEIIKWTGEGSLGDDIYLCRQKDLKREVSVRILPQDMSRDTEMVQRFTQGIELSAMLQHPNILPAFEAGTHAGRAYMATAADDGESLSALIKREGGLGEARSEAIALSLAEALDYAWSKGGILHRNLRPDSIIIANGGQPLITDFGMAKRTGSQDGAKKKDATLTMVGFTIGNPDYMSPEQVSGESDLDCRSDIYCLGLLLYECLAGEAPFKSPSQIALMEMQLNKPHKSLKSVNASLSDACSNIVDKMLAKERSARYQSYGELIADLKKAIKGEGVGSSVKAAPKSAGTTKQGAKKSPAPSIGAAIAVAAGILLLFSGLFYYLHAQEKASKLARLGSLFESAESAAKEAKSAADFDIATADFESLKEQAAGTEFEAKISGELEKLKASKEDFLKAEATKKAQASAPVQAPPAAATAPIQQPTQAPAPTAAAPAAPAQNPEPAAAK